MTLKERFQKWWARQLAVAREEQAKVSYGVEESFAVMREKLEGKEK